MRHFTLLTYLTLLAFPLCVQNASAQQEVKLKPRVIFTSSRAVPEPGKAEVAARTGQFEMSPNERAVFFSDRASWRKKVSSKTGGSKLPESGKAMRAGETFPFAGFNPTLPGIVQFNTDPYVEETGGHYAVSILLQQ